MTRREIAGGSYVEAWPSGDYACLMAQSHVETSAGNVPIPPGSGLGPIYTRLYVGAGLRLTGQDQVSGNAWLWDGLRWVNSGDSYGVSPCAFGPLDGFLYIATAGWGKGSQGIRYIRTDGAIISGDDTYADPVEKIYQFTTQGDVTIGQDQEDGVIVVYAGMRKRLATGNCQFIRFNRAGDRLAVAWWTPKANAAQLAWFNVSEIASLPDAPLVFDKPKPKPPRPEPQMPWTPKMPNRVDVVERLKHEQPAEWGAMQHGDTAFIRRLAWTLHQIDPAFGLNGKRGSDVLSEDCVAYQNASVDNGPEVADVVIGHGGPDARPGWINVTKDSQGWKADGTKDAEGGSGAKWIRPSPVAGQPNPPPGPTPQPPSQELATARRRIAELEAVNAQLLKRPVATGGNYDEMMAAKDRMLESYAKGALGREQAEEKGIDHAMPSATVFHLAFRYLREGYTADQLVADAKIRGEGGIPQ